MTSTKKHKIVTILDILEFLDLPTQSERTVEEDLQEKFNLKPDVAEGLLSAAEELGYIDEYARLSDKGNQHLADCTNQAEVKGTLTLIRGLCGAGKTHVAQALLVAAKTQGKDNVIHLESDQYMVDAEGNYKFSIDKVRITNIECIAQTELYLRMGYDVIVSNAFAQYWEIRPYYDIAALLGVKTVLIEVQSQFLSERRSPHTRQQMVEKWESIFLPRTWHQHKINLLDEPTKGKENVAEPNG